MKISPSVTGGAVAGAAAPVALGLGTAAFFALRGNMGAVQETMTMMRNPFLLGSAVLLGGTLGAGIGSRGGELSVAQGIGGGLIVGLAPAAATAMVGTVIGAASPSRGLSVLKLAGHMAVGGAIAGAGLGAAGYFGSRMA